MIISKFRFGWKIATQIVVTFGLFCCSLASAEIFVVSSKKGPLNSIKIEEVRELYLGRKINLVEGGIIQPIDRIETSDNLRSRFYKSVLGWTMARTKAHWSQLVFTGKGDSPFTVSNFDELKKKLNENEFAIGFSSSNEDAQDLKILLKIQG